QSKAINKYCCTYAPLGVPEPYQGVYYLTNASI
ncbi:MAG: hypothetical protein ACI90V_007880, partial [Bacillariaceae sp.]